jgi:hypothetical protein
MCESGVGPAGFHAPESMTWSRVALPSYLYGRWTGLQWRALSEQSVGRHLKHSLAVVAVRDMALRCGRSSPMCPYLQELVRFTVGGLCEERSVS